MVSRVLRVPAAPPARLRCGRPRAVLAGPAGRAGGLYGWLMRVHVVSDGHGRAEALAGAGGADGFICLGDLLLFIDYADHRQGIFPDLFGAGGNANIVALRLAKRFDEDPGVLPGAVGPARRRSVRARAEGSMQPVRGTVRGHAEARLHDLRQRGYPAAVAASPEARARGTRRAAGRARRLDFRIRWWRAAFRLPTPTKSTDEEAYAPR